MDMHIFTSCYIIQSDMLKVFHSPAHLSLPALHQLQRLSQLLQSPVLLRFPLLDVIMTTDAMPFCWAFSIQSLWAPVSCCCTWSGSMCKVHSALQELKVVALMLCKIAFHLSNKVAAFQFNNNFAKAYFRNQGGTTSLFLSRVACCILNLADKHVKHGVTLIPIYIPTHLNVEAKYPSQGWLIPEWHVLPCIAQAAFNLWCHPEGDLLASSHTKQCLHFYTLESLQV